MKKNILNEELNSMKYLFDYKRGRVISEQGAASGAGASQQPAGAASGAGASQQPASQQPAGAASGAGASQQPASQQPASQQPTTNATLKDIQNTLISLGYKVSKDGTADGKLGPMTLGALATALKSATPSAPGTQGAPQACPAGQVFDETIKKCTLPAVTVTANKSGSPQQGSEVGQLPTKPAAQLPTGASGTQPSSNEEQATTL